MELGGTLSGLWKVGRGEAIGACCTDLISLVGLIGGRNLLVERHDDLLQLGPVTIVVGIGDEDDLRGMIVAGYLKGAISTTLGQMVGKILVAILVNQAFLHYVGA